MTLTENGTRIQVALHAARTAGDLLKECERIKTLNAIAAMSAAKKVAPYMEQGLKDMRDAMRGLHHVIDDLRAENEQLKADRVPGQFTDRVVNIQGREGFKWQVML